MTDKDKECRKMKWEDEYFADIAGMTDEEKAAWQQSRHSPAAVQDDTTLVPHDIVHIGARAIRREKMRVSKTGGVDDPITEDVNEAIACLTAANVLPLQVQGVDAVLLQPDVLRDSDLRLRMGEMTAQECRTARAAIGWANSCAAAEIAKLREEALTYQASNLKVRNDLKQADEENARLKERLEKIDSLYVKYCGYLHDNAMRHKFQDELERTLNYRENKSDDGPVLIRDTTDAFLKGEG